MEWVSFWATAALALPTDDELRGTPGNVVPAAVAPQAAIASPALENAGGASAAATAAKPRAATTAVAPVAATAAGGGLASPTTPARPPSRGGATGAKAAAAAAGGSGVAAVLPGSAEAAAFSRLRVAAAAVRGVWSPRVLSRASVRRPLLTIQALKWLVDVLCTAGASARAAPILALWYAVSSDLLPAGRTCMPLVAQALAATAMWADGGGYGATAANAWTGVLRLVAASEEVERSRYDGELAVAEMQRQRGGASGGGQDSAAQSVIVQSPANASSRPRPRTTAAQARANAAASVREPFRRIIPSSSSGSAAADIPVRVVWAELAAVLARAGYVTVAKQLLIDVRRHAAGFRDGASARKAAAVASVIAVTEGDFTRATDDVEKLLQPSSGLEEESTSQDWLGNVLSLAAALRGKGRHGDVVALLAASVRCFSDAVHPQTATAGLASASGDNVEVDLDAVVALVRCRVALAAALAEWASARTSTSALSSPDANVLAGIRDAWDAAIEELTRAEGECREHVLSTPLLVEVLVAKVRRRTPLRSHRCAHSTSPCSLLSGAGKAGRVSVGPPRCCCSSCRQQHPCRSGDRVRRLDSRRRPSCWPSRLDIPGAHQRCANAGSALGRSGARLLLRPQGGHHARRRAARSRVGRPRLALPLPDGRRQRH